MIYLKFFQVILYFNFGFIIKECRFIKFLNYGEGMRMLKIWGLAVALVLPVSLLAETKSSKLNATSTKSLTPAKVHEGKHPVTSSVESQDVVKSLSNKNQKVFEALSTDDQKRISAAKKAGKDPQKKMMEILSEDQKSVKSKPSSDKKTGFVWDADTATPAHKHTEKKAGTSTIE